MERAKISDRFMAMIIVAGALCVLTALATIDLAGADIYLALLYVFTIAVGSRVTIQIPRFKSHISVSDTFIFLVLLLYGGQFAVILASIEATASAWRFCNRRLTVFYNAATMAISTSAVVVILNIFGLYTESQMHGYADDRHNFVIVLSLIALTDAQMWGVVG